ncbi:hypothetical protein HDU98_008367 [Podochytrium sp. JEL0797]|nr:hypothetical protein HDU98_008367 [Podochytrium sp. JEL0797]
MQSVFLVAIGVLGVLGSATTKRYDEHLRVTQSLDGKTLLHFTFEQHFPRGLNFHPMLSVADEFGVAHLDLSFTQGKGSQCIKAQSGDECVAPGLVLWAWLGNTTDSSVSSLDSLDRDARWTGLTNALAGTFCASMNFITPKVSAEPTESFRVDGIDPASNWLRYATLPREITCTENLTPWAKLLPCSTKSGIASLFNAYSLYDADYHSMRVKMHRPCPTCPLELVQELLVMLDPVRKGWQRNLDWSFKFFLNREIMGLCPLAGSNSVGVVVELPVEKVRDGVQISGGPYSSEEEGVYTFPLELGKPLDVSVKYTNPAPYRDTHPIPPVQIHRHLTGYGRERGGINIRLTNTSPSPHSITLLEVVPWYLMIYLHTLETRVSMLNDSSFTLSAPPMRMKYQPNIPRLRPTVLEMTTTLPPDSVTTIHYAFDRAFIKYTEHPPDANRGFDIGPAVVTVHSDKPDSEYRLYSEILLIALPTPDFSMPYNVITMTCTIVALYFGTVFNLIVKRLEGVEDKKVVRRWWMFWVKKEVVVSGDGEAKEKKE